MKEIYILSYVDNELITEQNVFTSKLQAINAFHEKIEEENTYLKNSDMTEQFEDESVPEDEYYVATCFGEEYEGKIEIVKHLL